MTLESTPQTPSQTGPEMSPDLRYPDLRYPNLRIRPYLGFLLLLLREYVSGPRIGYARLVNARNILMVIRIAGFQQVIYLGNTSEP